MLEDWMIGPIAFGVVALGIVGLWMLFTGRLPPYRPPFEGGGA